jgi:hypothetical protein
LCKIAANDLCTTESKRRPIPGGVFIFGSPHAYPAEIPAAGRKGDWEFLETPELKQAKQEIKRLNNALELLSRSARRFPPRQSAKELGAKNTVDLVRKVLGE